MNPGLPRSLGLSALVHAALILLGAMFTHLLAPRMPPITEISLITGPGAGPTPAGPVATTPRPGGRRGTSATATAKRVTKGTVVISTPEFVPIGKKPRRSGEELMGAGPGDGGAAGPSLGTGPATGGAGRKVRYAEPLAYPDWAREQGIDAKVVVRFKIYPNGSVDPNIIVRRTSGWRQLDEMVIKALRQYQFEPLPADAAQEAQMAEIPIQFKAE